MTSSAPPSCGLVSSTRLPSFAAILFVTVVLKFASSPKAAANSFRVFNELGAASISSSNFNCALASALVFV